MLAEVFREIDSDARGKRNLPIRGETCGSRNYSREHILVEKVYRKKGYMKTTKGLRRKHSLSQIR